MDNTQNPYLQQFQNNGDSDTATAGTQPAPGSLDFVPSTPEKTAPETAPKPNVEKQPMPETPSVPPEQTPVPTDTPQIQQPVTPAQPAKPNLQDKTATITELHHVQNPKDKLTSIADTEEEEFISEVEAAHGHS